MDFVDLIKNRHSTRKYDADKKINQEQMIELINQAQLCPSWKNTQATRYHCILSEEMKEKVRQEALPLFNAKNSAGASALLVSTVKEGISGLTTPGGEFANELEEAWGIYDLGLHDAYLILAAKNQGIDSLIMGIRDGDALREILNIPEDETIVAVIALGYAKGDSGVRSKKSAEEMTQFY